MPELRLRCRAPTRPTRHACNDYYLGGRDNHQADREAADRVKAVFPTVQRAAWTNRRFMQRATRYAAERGIVQFLDVGTGIPTEPNLHQVARKVAPSSRVVYVDNDPVVLAYARALLEGISAGRTCYLSADLREPEHILAAPELRRTLDLSRPVAVSLVAVMHFLGDIDDPYGVVNTLMDSVAPGSLLVMCHATADFRFEALTNVADIYQGLDITFRPRSREEFSQFFEGLTVIDPGVVGPHDWQPAVLPVFRDSRGRPGLDADVSCWAAVGCKPSARSSAPSTK